MHRALALATMLFSCFVAQAQAVPRRIAFGPPTSQVAFRAYKLGLLPVDVTFTRFSGWLTYDPADRASCHVDLRVDAASLATDSASVRDTVAGPKFLNVSSFPWLTYSGTCHDMGLDGTLGMHGVTRPFALALTWDHDGVQAQGRLLRVDWGMTAMPILVGRTIRIRVLVHLHPDGSN